MLDSLTGSFAPLFEDDGVTPKSNPTTTSSSGMYSFVIAAGVYDITVFSTAPMIKVNIIEDPSIIYRINSGAPLLYGDSVYISGDGLVALAGTTGTAEEARVLAICVETTLATGATGRFRHFGMITHTGTPGALGYLGQDGLPTETVPLYASGDKFSTILGRQFSNSQFHVRGVSGDGKGGGIGVSLELTPLPPSGPVEGWNGVDHGMNWFNLGGSIHWVDRDLYFQYTHPGGSVRVNIQSITSTRPSSYYGIKVEGPGGFTYDSSSSGNLEFNASMAGVYKVYVYVDPEISRTNSTFTVGTVTITMRLNSDSSTDKAITAPRRGCVYTYTTEMTASYNAPISPTTFGVAKYFYNLGSAVLSWDRNFSGNANGSNMNSALAVDQQSVIASGSFNADYEFGRLHFIVGGDDLVYIEMALHRNP